MILIYYYGEHKLCRSKRGIAERNQTICILVIHRVSEAEHNIDKTNSVNFEIVPLCSRFAVCFEFLVALLKVIGRN